MPLIFAYGFRVFFASAAVHAVVLMAAWLASFAFGSAFAGSQPLAWHAHEMLFGLVAAAIAGFLLTAVPNWTARPRLHGGALLALWLLWLVPRVGYLVLDPAAPGAAALALRLFDLAFLPGLALVVAVPILESGKQTGNRRNLVMVVLLSLLFVANLLHGIPGFDRPLAGFTIDLIMLMMAIIGGRITPLFTRSWLLQNGLGEPLPASRNWLDLAALVALGLTAVAGGVSGASGLTAVLAALAAALHLARLLGWRGWRARRDPLIWVLHLGYAWIVIALALRALGIVTESVPANAWFHAAGVGAAGTLILGVMARVSLGHTGRELRLPRGGAWMFVLITLAAIARTGAAVGWLPYMNSLYVAGSAWMAAFGLFCLLYFPILFAPRADGRPG